MGNVKFVHSSAGYIELMQSGAMQAVCHEKAEGIAAAAQGNLHPDRSEQHNPAYFVNDRLTGERAVSTVATGNPHAMAAELEYGPLQNAAGV